MNLPDDFKELLTELARFEVEFVIIGGYAFAFHAEPRATKDIDILITGSRENRERVAQALLAFGLPATVANAARSQKETEVVYFGRAPLRVDILRSVDGIDTQATFAKAVHTKIDNVAVRVIDLDSLIMNKRAAGRARDLADVERLEEVRSARGQTQRTS